MLPELVTIPISHYGERARWALDLAGVDYREIHHLQTFSWVAALRRGGKKTLPVLVTDDGTLADSSDIVKWAMTRSRTPQVAAGAEGERLERQLADDYGVETRRVGYEWFFRARRDMILGYNAGRAPAWEVATVAAAFPFMKAFMSRYLDISPASIERGKDTVQRTMDRVASRLSDGRPFLMGDTFTTVDLTFAAMSAPGILPPRYGVRLPALGEIPEDAARSVAGYREHPAGRFALRLYEERPAPRGR